MAAQLVQRRQRLERGGGPRIGRSLALVETRIAEQEQITGRMREAKWRIREAIKTAAGVDTKDTREV